MYRALFVIALVLTVGCWGAQIVESGSLKEYIYGQGINPAEGNWISHLAEGIALQDYNLYAPYDVQTNGFGDFRVASTAELASWDEVLDLFLAGNYAAAQTWLDGDGMPFQIVQFNDTDTGRTLYMIREIPDTLYVDDNGTEDSYDDERGAFTWGWGIYIHDPAATRPIIVTVPHPCDDFPMPALAVEAFGLWNARFMCIAGAGREVRWTNIGSYDNSKSLSDPSRAAAHPFNRAYQKFAGLIRSETGTREWSAQLHSYDWNRHDGYANIQVSAGYQKLCPNLPIRDLSTLKLDLINAGNHLMIPANTIGTHEEVFLNDFYAVNYSIHEFIFDDGINSYAVNNRIDLPAYSLNRQMLYTLDGWNDYDSYEPFFHSEMDELPSAYSEDIDTYHWFYGWDPELEKWDQANLFTSFLAYYSRCIIDLESVLPQTLAMDDQMPPTAPASLAISSHVENAVTLVWERSSAYDFQTYEVLYSQEPISAGNYLILDRAQIPFLASQGCESTTISGLLPSTQYFFRLRALDKNGNYSQPSNEVHLYPLAAQITWSPPYLYQTLAPGQTAQQQLILGNLGDEILEYTCSLPLTSITVLEEGFEDAAQLPAGWTQEFLAGALDWTFASGGVGGHPAGAYEGSLNARLQNSGQSCRTRLITPVLDLGSADSATLTFWHSQAADGNKQDKLKVLYSTSPVFGWIELAYYENNIAAWTQKTLNLPDPGSSYYLAFEGITGKGFGVCLDEIRVDVQTIGEVPWLSINSANLYSGSISPGEQDHLVSIEFSAAGLVPGTYSSQILLRSNSQIDGQLYIPVELAVAETPAPEIVVEPLILDFGNVPVGNIAQRQFTVTNPGNAELAGTISTPPYFEVAEIRSSLDFRLDKSPEAKGRRNLIPYNVLPNSAKSYQLTFTPPADTFYHGFVDISSNVPNNPMVQIAVQASAHMPLQMALPDTIFIPAGVPTTIDFSQYVTGGTGQDLSLSCSPANLLEIEISGLSVTFWAGMNSSGSEAISFTVTDLSETASDQVLVVITGGRMYARIKVFLQGPYLGGNMMTHGLMDVLPHVSPYDPETILADFPNVSPHHLVDWIFVQLRQTESGPLGEGQSLFLCDDGMVIDMLGNSVLSFPVLEQVSQYVVIRHRNHLGIMSASSHAFSFAPDSAPLIDLGSLDSVYGGNNTGVLQIEPGVLALYAGDANQDGGILPSDLNQHWRVQAGLMGYLSADFNLDGAVLPSDMNMYWRLNAGLQTQIPLVE